jgi:uncharacterized repeat protein (TIGR03803 family)
MLRKPFSVNVRNAGSVALITLLLAAVVAAGPAQAQTYTVLHAFTAGSDGAVPGPLIRDAQGNLYGTTRFGGITSCGEDTCGTVFKVDSAGKETVLYGFQGGSNGSNPVAGLVRDAKGNLFGTTQGNGFIGGDSVVFKVDPKGQQTVLFNADVLDACCLDSPLALDAQGNLYGMSPFGGEPNCGLARNQLGCGTLFKLSPAGKFTVLHVFKGKDGIQPEGGVVLDGKGNIYGVAAYGGKLKCDYPGWGQPAGAGCGTIYKRDHSGKFSILHTFTGPGDGSYPLGLIIDSAGNLYGIAESGGDVIKHSNYEYGIGTVFKVDASGKFSVLFTFTPGTTRNNLYANHLVRDSNGNLYGLQEVGESLFRIDGKGNYTDLYDFEGEGEGSDGFNPVGIVLGSAGDVYGSMFLGGPPETECADFGFTNGCGTVFHLAPFADPSAGNGTR